MKKILIILFLIVGLLSCEKDLNELTEIQKKGNLLINIWIKDIENWEEKKWIEKFEKALVFYDDVTDSIPYNNIEENYLKWEKFLKEYKIEEAEKEFDKILLKINWQIYRTFYSKKYIYDKMWKKYLENNNEKKLFKILDGIWNHYYWAWRLYYWKTRGFSKELLEYKLNSLEKYYKFSLMSSIVSYEDDRIILYERLGKYKEAIEIYNYYYNIFNNNPLEVIEDNWNIKKFKMNVPISKYTAESLIISFKELWQYENALEMLKFFENKNGDVYSSDKKYFEYKKEILEKMWKDNEAQNIMLYYDNKLKKTEKKWKKNSLIRINNEIKRYGEDSKRLTDKAFILVKLWEYDKALEIINEVLEEYWKGSENLINRAYFLSDKASILMSYWKNEEALKEIDNAIKILPSDIHYRHKIKILKNLWRNDEIKEIELNWLNK